MSLDSSLPSKEGKKQNYNRRAPGSGDAPLCYDRFYEPIVCIFKNGGIPMQLDFLLHLWYHIYNWKGGLKI